MSYPQQPFQPQGGGFGQPMGGFDGGMPQGGPGAPGAPAGKAPKAPKAKASKKLINTNRGLTLVFAGVLAVLVLLSQFGANGDQVWVARASGAIQPLTEITPTSVKPIRLHKDLVEPGAITAPTEQEAIDAAVSELEGLKSRGLILTGQQIRAEQFSKTLELTPPLTPEERLVSFTAGVAQSVAGQLRAGDHVDVLVVSRSNNVASIVASDVELVSATVPASVLEAAAENPGGTSEEGGGTGAGVMPIEPIPGTYVARVSQALASQLALADETTEIYLLLRTPGTSGPATTPKPTIFTLPELLCGSKTAVLNENGCSGA